MFSFDLLLDAVVIGVLLGCFYAAVSLGLSISFGLLDVPHVAHPAFLVLASYAVYLPQRALRDRSAAGGAADHAAVLPVRPRRLPPVLRDLRKARQRRRRARHRVLLRHRLHHRSADHPAIRRRPALGHRNLYRQGLADRRHADSVPADRRVRGRRRADDPADAVSVARPSWDARSARSRRTRRRCG